MNISFNLNSDMTPLFISLVIIWLLTVYFVATTKTKDPVDRIVWLLIVLFLNILGSAICISYNFVKWIQSGKTIDLKASEEDIKKRANEANL
ncbi:MAG: PLDc N-terminal domain-containing protein [Verrucomicrobiota bacterium]